MSCHDKAYKATQKTYIFGKMRDNTLLSYDVMCLFRWSAVRKIV